MNTFHVTHSILKIRGFWYGLVPSRPLPTIGRLQPHSVVYTGPVGELGPS